MAEKAEQIEDVKMALDSLIDHPIVNHYLDEVSNEPITCNSDDYEVCDYEAN